MLLRSGRLERAHLLERDQLVVVGVGGSALHECSLVLVNARSRTLRSTRPHLQEKDDPMECNNLAVGAQRGVHSEHLQLMVTHLLREKPQKMAGKQLKRCRCQARAVYRTLYLDGLDIRTAFDVARPSRCGVRVHVNVKGQTCEAFLVSEFDPLGYRFRRDDKRLQGLM